jgi:hypothetical protein
MSVDTLILTLFEGIWNSKPDSKGPRNEKRAVAAFGCREGGGAPDTRLSDVPEWFCAIYNAGRRLDAAGIDIVVWTDAGRVRIQIKSSQKNATLFREKQKRGTYRPDIAVVVIDEDNHGAEDIRRLIIAAATEQYEILLAKNANKVGVQFLVRAA